jgi:hypothetical protein
MEINGIQPISFKIYKGSAKKSYGEYMWGIYRGKKIEVFDARKKENQFLIYVSENMKFLKSKLTYLQDGIKKILKAEGKT